MEALGAVLCLLLVALLIALAIGSPPKCAVCDAPIYHTKAGYRHKPGHAPADGHRAVLAEKNRS